MKKVLSSEAKLAIQEETSKAVNEVLDEKFDILSQKLINDISVSLLDYLTYNRKKIELSTNKVYRAKLRKIVEIFLLNYRELCEFVAVSNLEDKTTITPKRKKKKTSIKTEETINQMTLFLDDIENETVVQEDFKTNISLIKEETKEEKNQKALKLKKMLDTVFDFYLTKAYNCFGIDYKVVKETKEQIDYLSFETRNRIACKELRKLILLQEIYINGKNINDFKKIFGKGYEASKNFNNDLNSLIEDLIVLILGIDGLNYIMLEKVGVKLL